MMPWAEIATLLSYYGFTRESVPPLLAVGFLLYIFISRNINSVKERTNDIENCIVEMQGILKNKYKLQFSRGIANKYGQSNSPIGLKDEFRNFVTDPGLDKQIEEEKSNLVELLKKKKPKTGLDAQDEIEAMVISQEIEKYLDLTKYEQNLYKKGKTSQDAIGILVVYLFEVLIPELDISD